MSCDTRQDSAIKWQQLWSFKVQNFEKKCDFLSHRLIHFVRSVQNLKFDLSSKNLTAFDNIFH